MGFTLDDIKQVILAGFKSAFLPFHVKQQYLRRVSEELNTFVHEQGDAANVPPSPSSRTSPLASPPSAAQTVQIAAQSKPGQN
jgi:adenosine deaminase